MRKHKDFIPELAHVIETDGRKWFHHPNNADEPCGDTEAVAEFDKFFPPKVKTWQPSQ